MVLAQRFHMIHVCSLIENQITEKKLFLFFRYNCYVSLTVSSKTGKVTRLPASHEHDSDLLKQQVTEAKKQAILNGANNPTVATRTIVGNLASKVK